MGQPSQRFEDSFSISTYSIFKFALDIHLDPLFFQVAGPVSGVEGTNGWRQRLEDQAAGLISIMMVFYPGRSASLRYYKGLGTSTPKEAKVGQQQLGKSHSRRSEHSIKLPHVQGTHLFDSLRTIPVCGKSCFTLLPDGLLRAMFRIPHTSCLLSLFLSMDSSFFGHCCNCSWLFKMIT